MAEVSFIGKTDVLYIFQLISGELAKYVKADKGKGLSTEDFTTALKEKLTGIDLSQYSTTAEMTAAINAAVAETTGIELVKPEGDTLPTTGEKGKIYLIPNSGSGQNVYDEYYWDGTKFELFGTTTVNLTGYLKKTDVTELSATEVKAAWDSVFTS